MAINDNYSNGIIDALEKIAYGMSMEQAREYVKAKNDESGQSALFTGIGGVGAGVAEGLGDFTPISGRALVIPGAIAGAAASKLKNVFTSPKEMYMRNGLPTGRAIGGLAGGGIGAGVGAGIGGLIDNSGWGLGLGGLLGGLIGQGAGQSIGDYVTERANSGVVRKAKREDIEHKLRLDKKYR